MQPDLALFPMIQAALPVILLALRAVLGWFSIALGVLGSIFPVIPGLPFLILGVYLVGHRNRVLRWSRVHIRLIIRWASRSRIPWLRWAGCTTRRVQHETMQYMRRWRSGNSRKIQAVEHAAPPHE
jgi:hypothetical protein